MSNIQKILKPLLFCLATLFCFALASQEEKRVAIAAPIAKTSNVTMMEKNIVLDYLTEVIVNSSQYVAIDRINTDGILSEHSYQRDGLVDPTKIKALGQQLRADLVCVTYITKEQGYYQISASVIDVDTAKIFNAATHVTEAATPIALKAELEVWAYKLLKLDQLTGPAAEAKAARDAIAERTRLEREAKEREAREAEERRLAQIEKDKREAADRERAEKEARTRNPQFREGGPNDNVADHVPVKGKAIVYIYRLYFYSARMQLRINNTHFVDLPADEQYVRVELYPGKYNISAKNDPTLSSEALNTTISLEVQADSVHYIKYTDGFGDNLRRICQFYPMLASTAKDEMGKCKLRGRFYMQ